jgi:CysZ protein
VYNPRVGLVRGFLAPFRGGVFVARQRLWRYLLLPLLVNVALGLATMVAAARFFREELAQTLSSAPVLGWIFLAVTTVLGGVVLFIVLQPLVSAIFCDRLSEIVEKRVRGSVPSVSFLASTGRALVHGLLKAVCYGLAILVGALLTPFLGPLGTVVGVALGAVFLAYDGFDYPLARRGRTFGGKWAYLLRHPGQTIGYGAGATLLYLVPLALFVAPAFTAAGATLAFLDAESKAAARQPAAAAPAGADKPADAAEKTTQSI